MGPAALTSEEPLVLFLWEQRRWIYLRKSWEINTKGAAQHLWRWRSSVRNWQKKKKKILEAPTPFWLRTRDLFSMPLSLTCCCASYACQVYPLSAVQLEKSGGKKRCVMCVTICIYRAAEASSNVLCTKTLMQSWNGLKAYWKRGFIATLSLLWPIYSSYSLS